MPLSKRILDFSFGVSSALDAKVDCIADKVFVITRGKELTDEERTKLRNQGGVLMALRLPAARKGSFLRWLRRAVHASTPVSSARAVRCVLHGDFHLHSDVVVPAGLRQSWVTSIVSLGKLCDPYLDVFRRFIPPIGGMIDVSPIVALLVLQLATRFVVGLL